MPRATTPAPASLIPSIGRRPDGLARPPAARPQGASMSTTLAAGAGYPAKAPPPRAANDNVRAAEPSTLRQALRALAAEPVAPKLVRIKRLAPLVQSRRRRLAEALASGDTAARAAARRELARHADDAVIGLLGWSRFLDPAESAPAAPFGAFTALALGRYAQGAIDPGTPLDLAFLVDEVRDGAAAAADARAIAFVVEGLAALGFAVRHRTLDIAAVAAFARNRRRAGLAPPATRYLWGSAALYGRAATAAGEIGLWRTGCRGL